jgi:hypothetical protein
MNMPCITAEETKETDEKESRETRPVCPDISRGTACHIGCPDSPYTDKKYIRSSGEEV